MRQGGGNQRSFVDSLVESCYIKYSMKTRLPRVHGILPLTDEKRRERGQLTLQAGGRSSII